MKRVLISALLAGAMCVSLVGCNLGGNENSGDNGNNGNNNQNQTVTVTENTDPVALKGEKVDRTAWTQAFQTESNYSVKSNIKMTLKEDGETVTDNVTLVFRITPDKMSFSMTFKEGNETMQAEAYAEINGNTVSLWDRSKEGGDWSEWSGEEYSKEELSQTLSMIGNLGFAKEQYANFSYSDADKGYAATTSGLASMKEALDQFVESVLAQLPDVDANVAKIVLKLVGGKPGALIMDMTVGTTEEANRTRTEGTEGENGGDGTSEEGGSGTPEQGGSGTPEQGGSGTPEQGGTQSGTVSLTQVYFDYGKTAVTRPTGLPTIGEGESEAKPKILF